MRQEKIKGIKVRKKSSCYRLNYVLSPCQIHVEVLTPSIPQNVFVEGSFTEVIKIKRGHLDGP